MKFNMIAEHRTLHIFGKDTRDKRQWRHSATEAEGDEIKPITSMMK